MAEAAIDVHYNKLLDWLLDRKKVPDTWMYRIRDLNKRKQDAIDQLPDIDALKDLKNSAPASIDYFKCARIREILTSEKKEENKAKGFFAAALASASAFARTDKVMQEWKEILKAYESEGLLLAEAAKKLVQNANFEIPYQAKVIKRSQDQIDELHKKEAEYRKAAVEADEHYEEMKKKYGITSSNITTDLKKSTDQLPQLLNDVGEKCMSSTIKAAVEYYQAYVAFVEGADDALASEEGKEVAGDKTVRVTPVLARVCEEGNTEMEMEAAADMVVAEGEGSGAALSIDWGDFVVEGGEGEVEAAAPSAGMTGFSMEMSVEGEEGGSEKKDESEDAGAALGGFGAFSAALAEAEAENGVEETANVNIDWGDFGVETKEEVEKVPSTMLENADIRTDFLNDCAELRSFLTARIHEMSGDEGMGAVMRMASAPQLLRDTPVERLQAQLDDINKVVSMLNAEDVQRLLLIRSSQRYVDNLVDSLLSMESQSSSLLARAEAAVAKRGELQERIGKANPILESLRKETKELKEKIEEEMSKILDGRQVRIMGEVAKM
mmetsp:Transcript_27985/g.71206  ORF Transcript_27985/g.71206 Transcript_27985/m.71206 type:complete len:552 (-) Transcript_27985:464-2119(-)